MRLILSERIRRSTMTENLVMSNTRSDQIIALLTRYVKFIVFLLTILGQGWAYKTIPLNAKCAALRLRNYG